MGQPRHRWECGSVPSRALVGRGEPVGNSIMLYLKQRMDKMWWCQSRAKERTELEG